MKIHPVLIGIVNALVPGLGYLILRERLVLGWGMFLAMIFFMIVTLTDPSPAFDTVLFAISPTGRLLECASYALAIIAFGYDAYDLAKKKQPVSVFQ
ncbi:MAG: hypothetical protein QOE22_743 [Candidatus Parcubacteria bacterium]|jgi:hypothetical protein|nr:hypothetical protein [Candidatus Parcubacteria bacterium]